LHNLGFEVIKSYLQIMSSPAIFETNHRSKAQK
jgi:hypothetical protein